MLAAYCLAESAASGLSLVDAYWRGRVPWMGIIEGLVVGGPTAAVVPGGLAVLVRGGWWRRAALVPLVAVAGLWWFSVVVGARISGGRCLGICPPRVIDPWAYAYSAPEAAFIFLILPSFAVAWLALAPARRGAPRAGRSPRPFD